jgi:hypothetical protein
VVTIPKIGDPTLDAMERAWENRALSEARRSRRLGASQIGQECERRLFYSFRWAVKEKHHAVTLARFEDGHHSEAVVADRLRMVPSVELHTHDENGNQFEYEACSGHFVAKLDGGIKGLLQSLRTWHVWEHKCTNDSKFCELGRAIHKVGEKLALKAWDAVYYAQAVVSMDLAEMARHYLTVSLAGSRGMCSVRTDENPTFARILLNKASRIIFATQIPDKAFPATDYRCKNLCPMYAVCHNGARADQNCRTCVNSEPVANGGWHCKKFDCPLDLETQDTGCVEYQPAPWANGVK